MLDKKVILEDFQRAYNAKKDWIAEAIEDYEFSVGKQWEDDKLIKLAKKGVRGLTINKIQPNVFMVSGIERQNRTDFKAFPEGSEDGLTSDIVTRLLKNVAKRGKVDYKLSEMFEDGLICGEGWIEPYIDRTYDLLNGRMRFKKVSPLNVFPDPDFSEYDMSDAEYIDKLTQNITENQAIQLYPDKKAEIERITDRKISIDAIGEEEIKQERGYESSSNAVSAQIHAGLSNRKEFDLIEHHYKEYATRYLVIDRIKKTTKEVENKEDAENYVKLIEELDAGGDPNPDKPKTAIIPRTIPEFRIAALLGDTVIDDYLSPYYPRWKSFSLIPFFGHRITTPIKNARKYMVQGIVRALKDPQRELNKRRTQEMRHLNSTANSGWLSQKGAWVKKSEVRKLGAAPGVMLEYNEGFDKPERINPAPLSQGHAQLAGENTNDMKEISGINSDLLAVSDDKSASGRAIFLRQKQGMVMIQRVMDNYGQTKKNLAQFILSQLGELFTTEKAEKVVGDAFVTKNFTAPVMQEGKQGTPVMEDNGQGQQSMKMEVNRKNVKAMFNMVLNDAELGEYDVAIGEGAYTETVKYANYLLLLEMAEKKIPIPPEVLIEESMLSEDSKKSIKQSIEQARQAEQQNQQGGEQQ